MDSNETVFSKFPFNSDTPMEFNTYDPSRDLVGTKKVFGTFNDPRPLTLANKYISIGCTPEESKALFAYINDVFFPVIGGCPKSLKDAYYRQVLLLLASELTARAYEGL